MNVINLAKASLLLAIFLIAFSGCSTSETVTEDELEDNPVRHHSGIDYYIPDTNIENFQLPDGTVMPLVLIPGGSFLMGLDNVDPFGLQPAGKVRVSINVFMMGETEVTNQQYRAFLNSLDAGQRDEMLPDSTAWSNEIGVPWGSYFWAEDFSDYPVVAVSWHQAKAFTEWAGLRLPAEAEWEYAARSGVSGRIFPWDGLDIRHSEHGIMANFAPGGDYGQDGYVITSPGGAFPPNNFRLYDMAGNVAEWCEDAYSPSYSALTRSGSQLVTPIYRSERENRRIVRGGSWASNDFFIGVGVRDFRHKDHASPRIGFRVARSVSDPGMMLNNRPGNNTGQPAPQQNAQPATPVNNLPDEPVNNDPVEDEPTDEVDESDEANEDEQDN